MSQTERDRIVAEALRKYGYKHQMMVAVEEMGELIKVLSKVVRYGVTEQNKANALEELADVYVTCRQVMMLLGIEDSDVVHAAAEKLVRLAKDMNFDYRDGEYTVTIPSEEELKDLASQM